MRNITFLLVVMIGFASYTLNAQQWTQLGNTVSGDNIGDLTGASVAINYDGTIFIVGLPGYNNVGLVRIYKWNGSSWQQMQSSIQGSTGGAAMGYSVSIDSLGNRIVVGERAGLNNNNLTSGLVKVYDRSGDSWVQKGSTLYGDSVADFFGYSVDISSDGNTIVVGVPQSEYASGSGNFLVGKVEVYEWNGSDWVQKGASISGQTDIEGKFGSTVAISSDGNVFAASAPFTTHYVKVYEWNGTQWVQRGSTLMGDASSVDINGDGTVLVVGDASENNGVVRVYQWDGTQWTLKGSEIKGSDTNSVAFGKTVSINKKGDVIAVGDPEANPDGLAYVFRWDGTQWTPVGNALQGQSGERFFSRSIYLNTKGNMVAVGAPDNVDIVTNAITPGAAKVFYNNAIVTATMPNSSKAKAFYNTNTIYIHFAQNNLYGKRILAILYDQTGRIVIRKDITLSATTLLYAPNLKSGTYFLTLKIDNEAPKIIPINVINGNDLNTK